MKQFAQKGKLPFIKLFAGVLVAFSVLGFVSCNSETKQEDTKEVAEEKNENKFENPKENDAEFMVAAAETSMKEIELGKIAQQRASLADVKALGKMMEEDHTKALNEAKDLAAKKQISLPASATEKVMEKAKALNEEKAADFDKEYCDMMISGHKDAISKFEKASTDANDADVKAWASAMLPSLRAHLAKSEECKKKCEQMKK